MPPILCLSNGHGEDDIACRIITALQQWPQAPAVSALPIVGVGAAYERASVPIVGPVQAMPSGGFVYMDGRQLARDVQSGLVQLTLAQVRSVKAWAAQGGSILAVGDIVPLALAWLSGAPYAFVGTAKSEYWLQDDWGNAHADLSWVERLGRRTGGVYTPWERWLMRHPRCQAVFPRDRLTTEVLQKAGIAALDVGNPMMDGLAMPDPQTPDRATTDPITILLLPGSRPPEAYANWQQILQAIAPIAATSHGQFLAAIAPSLPLQPFLDPLLPAGWHPTPTDEGITYTQASMSLRLTQSDYNRCLHQADIAIAMAGTATEQLVGLGKPAITMPGSGPQFTASFATMQQRLLGCSVVVVPEPTAVARELMALWPDRDRRQAIAANGRRRLGSPGAAQRIAQHLLALKLFCPPSA